MKLLSLLLTITIFSNGMSSLLKPSSKVSSEIPPTGLYKPEHEVLKEKLLGSCPRDLYEESILRKNGYTGITWETYNVITEDGYILQLFRGYVEKLKHLENFKTPILMGHG